MSNGDRKVQQLEEALQPIEDLLGSLKIESLKKSHNSVLLSFRQILDYGSEVRTSITDRYHRILLDTFLTLAQEFYVQFELDLLKKIGERGEFLTQAQSIVDQIKEDEEGKRLVRKELVERKVQASGEQSDLIKQFPSLMQNALDKLRDEWQRLETITVASKADEELIRILDLAVAFAAYSVGIEGKRILVVPGRQLAVYFFSYLESLAVLAVPTYSMNAPWDWSIFWHELAGYQARELEKETTIKSIREKLETIHSIETKKGKEERDDLIFILTNGIEGASDYLKSVFGWKADGPNMPDLAFRELGSFEYQFNRIIAALPPKERFAIYDDMKIQGWCVDWIKELFEDAFSVLAFRFTFIEYFDDILGRRGGRDDRHPSKEIRIAVARELLKLAGFQTPDGFQPKDEHEPQPDLSEEKRKEWKNKKAREEKIIKAVAKQIFSFVSLALAAWRYDAEASTNIKDQIYVQQKYPPNYLRESLDGLENWISGRITEWSKWINSMLPKGNSKGLTKEEMAAFLMLNVEEFIGLIRMDAEPIPQRDLLKGKNYQQLLALSFFDVDYHAPGDIELSEGGTQYWVKPTDWDSTAWSAQRKPHSAGKPVLLGHTIITKVSDSSQWSVNKSDWNSWFKMTQ